MDAQHIHEYNFHISIPGQVLYTGYYVGECLANGIGLSAPDQSEARAEITAFCVRTLAEGVSILARDATTKQIVGHVVNKLQVRDTSGAPSVFAAYMDDECATAAGKEYMRVMIELGAYSDLFAINRCDALLEVMFLGVLPSYARRSIGLKLVEYSLQLGRELKAGQHADLLPTAELRAAARRLGGATAMYASNYSKAIGRRLGFVQHAEMFYDRMEFDGKIVQERIPDALQRSIQLMSVPI